MDNQEAIKRIKEHIAIHKYRESHAIHIVEALEMAISALEKQIPKKPNMIQGRLNENLWNLHCPSCESWIGMWNSRQKRVDMHNILNGNRCPYCGQAIEWEENEE